MFYKVSVSFHKDFVKINGDLIDIGIMAKPIQGKANLVVIRQIAKHLGVPKSKIRLVAGAKSQNKIIEVVSS